MDNTMKQVIWNQFGASIDALKNAINNCPDRLWGDYEKLDSFHQYWYMVSHTLFWLDLDLTGRRVVGFTPPEPFGLEELDPAGVIPDRIYTKEELLAYLEHGRTKCHEIIMKLTDEDANRICKVGRVDLPFKELLLYSMRHVQHHTAQLNLLLRMEADIGSRWMFRAQD